MPVPPDLAQEEDAALAAGIAAGDEAALQELHRRYAPLVLHLACRSLDRAAAEEVTQDVFLALWRKAGTFDAGRGPLRTWLLGIARNRVRDELRLRQRRVATSEPPEGLEPADPDPLPDEAFWRSFQRRAIAQALAALPAAQQLALRLAFFSELSHEGVAEALRVPLGTAKTRIRSGLRGMTGRLGALVAGVLLLLGLPAAWRVRQRLMEGDRATRGVALLANSQLKVLKLLPPGATAAENGIHATFRGIPGQDLAVLTLSHVPPPPAGSHYVLWLVREGGGDARRLPDPDGEGRALLVLERLRGTWPSALSITAETRPGTGPAGPVLVEWKEATSSRP